MTVPSHARNQGWLPTPVLGELGQLHLLAWQPWQYCVPTTEDAKPSVWTWEVMEGRSRAILPRYLISDTNNCYILICQGATQVLAFNYHRKLRYRILRDLSNVTVLVRGRRGPGAQD